MWAEHKAECVAPPPHNVAIYAPPTLEQLSSSFRFRDEWVEDNVANFSIIDVHQALNLGPKWIEVEGLRSREQCEQMVKCGLIEAMISRLHEDSQWMAPLCRIVKAPCDAGVIRLVEYLYNGGPGHAFLDHLTEDAFNLTENALTVCQHIMVSLMSKSACRRRCRHMMRHTASALCVAMHALPPASDDIFEDSERDRTCLLMVKLMATMLLTADTKVEAMLVPELSWAVMFATGECYDAAVQTLRFVLSRRLATIGARRMHHFETVVVGLAISLFDFDATTVESYALLRDLLQCSPLLCKRAIADDCAIFDNDNLRDEKYVRALDVFVNGLMVHKVGVDAVKAELEFVSIVNDCCGFDDDEVNEVEERLRDTFNERLGYV